MIDNAQTPRTDKFETLRHNAGLTLSQAYGDFARALELETLALTRKLEEAEGRYEYVRGIGREDRATLWPCLDPELFDAEVDRRIKQEGQG